MCEPLKDKRLEMSYRHEQITSAVKWLKKRLWEMNYTNTNLYQLIDEAFEDAKQTK